MRIRYLMPCVGNVEFWERGDTRSVPDEEAQRLIERGIAEEAPELEGEKPPKRRERGRRT